jgi:predicted phage terminase large subunit-like protein
VPFSRRTSRAVRDAITEQKGTADHIVFSDIFPNVTIKKGVETVDLWQLDQSPVENFLATSPKGAVTGFGATMHIYDDMIRSAYEANHEQYLEDLYLWFTETMLSRFSENHHKIALFSTRWALGDLTGKIIENYKAQGLKVREISNKAYDGDKLLNPRLLGWETINRQKALVSEAIFMANYMQEPIELKGRLYGEFATYNPNELPQFEEIRTITDTADEGSDYLCAITYGLYQGFAYVLDVIYTQAPIEETEKLLVDALINFKVNRWESEKNFGGRSFMENVRTAYKGAYQKEYGISFEDARERGLHRTRFLTFHQKHNKQAKILAMQSIVNRRILKPFGWDRLFPEFYKEVVNFKRVGKNAHDDGVDVLSEIGIRLNKGKVA